MYGFDSQRERRLTKRRLTTDSRSLRLPVKRKNLWTKLKSYSVSDILASVICYLCCAYQLVRVTQDFFSFPVSSHVYIKSTHNVQTPIPTICTDWLYTVNFSRLYEDHMPLLTSITAANPSLEMFLNLSYVNSISRNGTLFMMYEWDEHLRQMSAAMLKDSILQPERFLKTKSEMRSKMINSTKTVIIAYDTCYVMNSGHQIQDDILSEFYPGLFSMITLELTPFSKVVYFKVYLHEVGTDPWGPNYIPVFLADSKEKTYVISYKRISIELLEKPYETHCQYYEKFRFKNRAHALDACYTSEMQSKYNFTCCSALREMTSNLSMIPDLKSFGESKFRSLSERVRETCEKRYPDPDCHKQVFIPRLSHFHMHEKGITTSLLFVAPLEPDLIVEYEPLIKLIDYFIQFGSILAFWFEFSILASAKQLIHIRCCRKRKVENTTVFRMRTLNGQSDPYEEPGFGRLPEVT